MTVRQDSGLVVGGSLIVTALATAALAVAMGPEVGMFALVGLMLAPALFKLRYLSLLAGAAMLFGPSIAALSGVEEVNFADETAVALLLVMATLHRLRAGGLRSVPGLLPLGVFAVVGVLSGVVVGAGAGLVATSAFITFKAWLFAFALAQIDWRESDLRRLVRLGGWVMAVLIGCLAANFLLGAAWVELFGESSFYTERYGIPALQGAFTGPLISGNVMACGLVVVLAHGWVYGATIRHRLLAIGATLGVLGSVRRTAALGALVAAVFGRMRHRGASTVIQVALLLPLVAVASWSVIQQATDDAYETYVVEASTTARSVMLRDMFDVANDHAPLGAGFGRFGSYLAGQDYSPEYIARGYTGIYGLHESTGNATYLTDTQWPAVIGEGGWIGGGAAILALLLALAYFLRGSRSEDQQVRWLSLSGAMCFVVLTVASIALPVFYGSSPPQVFLFGALGLLVGYRAQRPLDGRVGDDASSVLPGVARRATVGPHGLAGGGVEHHLSGGLGGGVDGITDGRELRSRRGDRRRGGERHPPGVPRR